MNIRLCSAQLVVREMQMKVNHFSVIWKILKLFITPSADKDVGKWHFHTLLVGVQIAVTFLESYLLISC